MCNNYGMARKYELKRRAERQQETRRRIVEAAIELHRTKGPARTTISDIARLAGVERHTLYRHFPSEWELGLACSGLHMETNPPPDAGAWLEVRDLDERRMRGLTELYKWYEADFRQAAASVPASVSRHAPAVRAALDAGQRVEVRWIPYDWSLNEKR